jgi:hypothetical protein
MLATCEIIDFLLPAIIILAVLILFARISARLRKRGGSLTSLLLGATYEFYNQDHRKAAEVVVEERSDKKQKEQDSGDEDDEGLCEERDAQR